MQQIKYPSIKHLAIFSTVAFVVNFLVIEIPRESIIMFAKQYPSPDFFYRDAYTIYSEISCSVFLLLGLIEHIVFHLGIIYCQKINSKVIKKGLVHIFIFMASSFVFYLLLSLILDDIRMEISPWNF
jgi:hypothetical protein